MRTENMGYRADPSAIKESADWTTGYRRDVSRAVNDNPGGAVLTAFGAGFGVGLAIGISMVMSTYRRPTARNRAEDLGHRVLESLQDYMPDSLSRRFG